MQYKGNSERKLICRLSDGTTAQVTHQQQQLDGCSGACRSWQSCPCTRKVRRWWTWRTPCTPGCSRSSTCPGTHMSAAATWCKCRTRRSTATCSRPLPPPRVLRQPKIRPPNRPTPIISSGSGDGEIKQKVHRPSLHLCRVAELRGRRRQPARRAAPGASCLFLLAGTGCNSCLDRISYIGEERLWVTVRAAQQSAAVWGLVWNLSDSSYNTVGSIRIQLPPNKTWHCDPRVPSDKRAHVAIWRKTYDTSEKLQRLDGSWLQLYVTTSTNHSSSKQPSFLLPPQATAHSYEDYYGQRIMHVPKSATDSTAGQNYSACSGHGAHNARGDLTLEIDRNVTIHQGRICTVHQGRIWGPRREKNLKKFQRDK